MTLLLRHDEPYLVILTLNRPEKRNALSRELLEELAEAVEEIGRDRDKRALILQGAGPIFCAGLDLEQLVQGGEGLAEGVHRLFKAICYAPLATIAALQGAALAGGAGIALACDFTIAEEGARFAFPEVKRGLVAALVMPLLLRRVGDARARELLLMGEAIDAAAAMRIGLVNRVAPEGQTLLQARELAEGIFSTARGAFAMSKQLLDMAGGRTMAEELDRALKWHREMRKSDEAAEGAHAFLEKRGAKWPQK